MHRPGAFLTHTLNAWLGQGGHGDSPSTGGLLGVQSCHGTLSALTAPSLCLTTVMTCKGLNAWPLQPAPAADGVDS